MTEGEPLPLLGQTLEELRHTALAVGLPAYAGSQLARWLYVQHARDFGEMSNISKVGRESLSQRCAIGQADPVRRYCSEDGTVKYLFPTSLGKEVEAVFIPEGERGTLCISSQAGCRMGCRFCMTGRQGFEGDLSTTDILNQLYSLPEREGVTNVVFMGQGEPLDNVDSVLRAIEILTAPYGYAWSPRRITVSTVGRAEGLRRVIEETECHIALSLHNPFPEERAAMMPAERGCSIGELLPLLAAHDWTRQRRLSMEYIVFEGVNDKPAHAKELARLVAPLRGARVNLLHFHEIPDTPYKPAREETMVWLRDYLTRHGITTTIRTSRGQDIMAACGMLGWKDKQGEGEDT